MKKVILVILLFSAVFSYFFTSINQDLKTKRNTVVVSLSDTFKGSHSLSVAVIGDVHLPDGQEPLDEFKNLILEIKSTQPDLVLFVGDYTSGPRAVTDMTSHRKNIANTIKMINPLPSVLVLGNYESWSSPEKWISEFNLVNLNVLENETLQIQTVKGPVCVRGFGDKFTERYAYVDFPVTCKSIPRLTITHDPAAAFDGQVAGLVIAGHTHCGQVRLPFFGPLWVPSDAPSAAHCGLYVDDEKTVFVTSGVGTSILPLRFGAPSQWDELNIFWN